MAILKQLITEAQELTNDWVILGGRVDVKNVLSITLYVDVDPNDSTDIQIRPIAYKTQSGNNADFYTLGIETGDTDGTVEVLPEVFDVPAGGGKLTIPVYNSFGIPYLGFQVKAGTVGATAGEILTAEYNLTDVIQ